MLWFGELCNLTILVAIFEIFFIDVSSQVGQLAQDEHNQMHLELLEAELIANLKWTQHVTDLAV